eukprot:m.18927 g.18927  ORF g.18927 m.18927 type:complete len:227 (+) comp6449_c0_seq1:80-760(+)
MSMSRPDGRAIHDLRESKAEVGVLASSDGSARFYQGETSVLVSVQGPGSVGPRSELPTRATLEVFWQPKTGIAGLRERAWEQRIHHALNSIILGDEFPRTRIIVTLQEMSNDGSLFACALNAASLALMDAGIPMRECVAAVEVAFSKGELILDPLSSEQKGADGTLSVGMSSTNLEEGLVLVTHAEGALAPKQFDAGLQAAREGCKNIITFFRSFAERRFARFIQT